jgi:hypothetical protein
MEPPIHALKRLSVVAIGDIILTFITCQRGRGGMRVWCGGERGVV